MLLQAQNLWKTYGSGETQVHALRGIDLSVKVGDFVSLVGPSGSGKSSLLHIIGAMDSPSQGEVNFEGRDLSKLSGRQLTLIRLRRIGFIFQTFNLIPTLTAVENIALPIQLTGISARQARNKAERLLEKVGLQQRAKHLPSQLSGGQRQRVAIARALSNDPALILADEPTGNLDSVSGDTIMNLLKELNLEGRTIIMVTHNSELAERVGRVTQIKDGQLNELRRTAAVI